MNRKHQFRYNTGVATVTTKKGILRGYEYDGLNIFKGIPYARAKRFHAPEPVESWEGEYNCISYGFVCPLLEEEKPAVELCVPHRYWPMNEDCQNLNIWTPGLDDGKRPVIVWLHGGGYEAGSAIEHCAYDGANMSREGDVVVVSINHRLNVLGYMDLSAFGPEYENSGNAGTADIIAALRWIHDNIALFGGDQANVCLVGQSGGGGKITTLLQSPEADGLYAKGINMSGVTYGLLPDCTGSGEDFVIAMMEELGVNSVKKLEEVPYFLLAKAYLKLRPVYQALDKNTGGTPYRNAHYLGDPQEVGFREETSQIPLLVGSVFGEFKSFNPAMADKNKLTKQEAEGYVDETLELALSDKARDIPSDMDHSDLDENTVQAEKNEAEQVTEKNKEEPATEKNKEEQVTEKNKEKQATGINERDIMRLKKLFRETYPERSILDLLQIDYIFRTSIIDYVKKRSALNQCTYSYLFNQDTALESGRVPWHCADIPYLFHNTEMAEYTQQDGVFELEKNIFESVITFARTDDPNHEGIPAWKPDTPEEEYVMYFANDMRYAVNPDHELIPQAKRILDEVFKKLDIEENIQH